MKLSLIVALSIVCMAAPANAGTLDLSGRASVIDGDTLEIHQTRIRIFGIDAPETNQLCRNEDGEHYRCGQKAANGLDAFIAQRPVTCVDIGERSFNRTVAVCAIAGVDIADWLVRKGLGLDWPKYSKGDYANAQSEAKRRQLGMWAGSFVEPWRYRACQRSGGTIVSCSDMLRDSAL